jgi:hypothetical protein
MTSLINDYDWKNTRRRDTFRFYTCDPRTLQVRKELKNVILDGSSITWSYTSDTRVSGKIKVLDPDYDGWSSIRVVHEIPDWNYINTLYTGVVTDDPFQYKNGGTVTTYELHSSLTMLADDLLPYHFIISKGAKASSTIKKIFSICGLKYSFAGNFKDYTYRDNKIFELGDDILSDLFSIADTSSNYMNVNPDGVITFNGYVNPRKKTSVYTLDIYDSRSIVLSGVSGSSNRMEVPTRVLVTYKSGQNIELAATADAKTGVTGALRGYTVAKKVTVNNLDPVTQSHIQDIANSKINEVHASDLEFDISVLYVPINAGDVVTFVLHDGYYKGTYKCLVKTIQMNLDTLVMKLTLVVV